MATPECRATLSPVKGHRIPWSLSDKGGLFIEGLKINCEGCPANGEVVRRVGKTPGEAESKAIQGVEAVKARAHRKGKPGVSR